MSGITRLVKLAGCAATFVLLFAAPVWAAEQTHLYSAARSLTGGCSVSSVDPIPDPGCPEGSHPPQAFSGVLGMATDPHGDVYVASYPEETDGSQARVDVFGPDGNFIADLPVPGARHVAVDAEGRLYVAANYDTTQLLRFDPTTYEPKAANITYGSPPVVIASDIFGLNGVAVNRLNQHVFVRDGHVLREYGAATSSAPNELLAKEIGLGILHGGRYIAVDAGRQLLYVDDWDEATKRMVVRVLKNDEDKYPLIGTIDGSTIPGKTNKFVENETTNEIAVGVEESTGHVFVGDIRLANKVYEFENNGSYVGTFGGQPKLEGVGKEVYVDNSPESANLGYLYVTSGVNHLLAFEPYRPPEPPVVEKTSTSGIQEDEAILHAYVNPSGLETQWKIEYVTQDTFEAEGFAAPSLAGQGTLAASREATEVTAAAMGLDPGTTYRFRVSAQNECEPVGCSDQKEAAFTTYEEAAQGENICANEAVRTGASAALPDCRAYELVTPAETGRRPPLSVGSEISQYSVFGSDTVSPLGQDLLFMINGGAIPGTSGNGVSGDAYLSTRTTAGWQTVSSGMSGSQAVAPVPGGISSDQRHMVWATGVLGGALSLEGRSTAYLRDDSGNFVLIGQGDLAVDRDASPLYISPGAEHLIFSSKVQLEPEAVASGSESIYDRTPDGVLHLVSVLPNGEGASAGELEFAGASEDGSAVAFTLATGKSPLYVRTGNTQTLEAGPFGAKSAGLSADGRYLFYTFSGDLYRLDTQGDTRDRITETGDVRPVIVSATGTGAYFLSQSLLGDTANPTGATPQAGAENLYYWDGTEVKFVATVSQRDAQGTEPKGVKDVFYDGLELWQSSIPDRDGARVPARTNPPGSVLLFESRNDLTPFETVGKAEVYRYDANAGTLICLSCSPVGQPPVADAAIESPSGASLVPETPVNRFSLIPNLTPDGDRAFFESPERLVAADNDGLRDVYEWEAQGKGSCTRVGGCVFLISSGQSAKPNYLYGVSESGDDVFISTSDLLLTEDGDETASIYDARVGGGFPSKPVAPAECLGEACQPAATPPAPINPANFETAGNVHQKGKQHCPRGKRHVRRKGRGRCVKVRHRHHRPRHHSGSNGTLSKGGRDR